MSQFNAAWEDQAYLSSVTDAIVKHEVLDCRVRLEWCHKREKPYQTARMTAWKGEALRRGLIHVADQRGLRPTDGPV